MVKGGLTAIRMRPRVRSNGYVPRSDPKAESQDWVQRLGPKFGSQVWVPRLSPKVGFQCFTKVGVSRLGTKVWYLDWVPIYVLG